MTGSEGNFASAFQTSQIFFKLCSQYNFITFEKKVTFELLKRKKYVSLLAITNVQYMHDHCFRNVFNVVHGSLGELIESKAEPSWL